MGHTALLRGALVLLLALLSIASASDASVAIRARTELRRLRVGSLSPHERDARCAAAHAALAPESSSWRSTRLYTTDSPAADSPGVSGKGNGASLMWSTIDSLHVTVTFPHARVGVRAGPLQTQGRPGEGVLLPPLEGAFELRCPTAALPVVANGTVVDADGMVAVASLRSRSDARYSPLRISRRRPAADSAGAARVLPPRLFLSGASGDPLRAAAARAFDVLADPSRGRGGDDDDDSAEEGYDDEEEEDDDEEGALRFSVPLRLVRPFAQPLASAPSNEEDEEVLVLNEEWAPLCHLHYTLPSTPAAATEPQRRGAGMLVTDKGAALGPFAVPLFSATATTSASTGSSASLQTRSSAAASSAPVPVRERAIVRLRRTPCARAHAFAHTLSVLTGSYGGSDDGRDGHDSSAAAGAVVGAGAAVRGQAHSADTVALLEAEVKVGGIIGKMINPVTGGITKPIMDLSDGLMMDSFTDHFTKKIYNSVNSEVAPDVSMMLGATLKANLTNVLVEAVTYAVSASLINSVKNAWVPPIVARLAEHLPPQVCPPLEHVLKAKIPRSVEGRVPQIVARGLALTLTQGLTKSITHAVVPALTHALPHHQNSDAYCTACATGTAAACRLCHFSARTVYYQLYYATFYADHYSGYYADYYTAAAQRVDEAKHLQMDLPGAFLLPQTVEYVARNEASMQRAEELNRTGTAPRATFVEVMPPASTAEEDEEAARAPLWGVPSNAPVHHPSVDTAATAEAGPVGG